MADLSFMPEAAWSEARRRAEVIRPLAACDHRPRHLVQDSDKAACLTLEELERWLAVAVAKSDRLRPQEGLDGQAPLQRWQDGAGLQRDGLLAAGIGTERLYEDHASGKCYDRPGLEACLEALRKGDTLVTWKFDRRGRDLRHLVNLVHDLTGRGVGLKVLAGQGANLDTTTANGRLVFGHLCGAGRVRARVDHRAHPCRSGVRSRSRPQRRTSIQDDGGKATARSGRHGPARHQGRQVMRRVGRQPSDASSSRYTHG